MKITNRFGLPDPVVRAVTNDPYSSGASDISVTRLINPPQLVTLTERYQAEIVEDAADRLWATFGQLMHTLLERAALDVTEPGRYLTEERLHVEIDGWILSGQFDLLDKKELALYDYKFVKEYAYKMAMAEGKAEWEQQLNILRWLVWKKLGILVNRLAIVCLIRDYGMRSEVPAGVVELPVWELDRAEAFICERVRLHREARSAPDAALPPCTDEERWYNARQGKYLRCENFCPGRGFCYQTNGGQKR